MELMVVGIMIWGVHRYLEEEGMVKGEFIAVGRKPARRRHQILSLRQGWDGSTT